MPAREYGSEIKAVQNKKSKLLNFLLNALALDIERAANVRVEVTASVL